MGAGLSTGKAAWIQQLPVGHIPRLSSRRLASPDVASLASDQESTSPAAQARKSLKLSQYFRRAGEGGFRVDSPTKWPDAGKLPRSAPPYTDPAREEPLEGGRRDRPMLSQDRLSPSFRFAPSSRSFLMSIELSNSIFVWKGRHLLTFSEVAD